MGLQHWAATSGCNIRLQYWARAAILGCNQAVILDCNQAAIRLQYRAATFGYDIGLKYQAAISAATWYCIIGLGHGGCNIRLQY